MRWREADNFAVEFSIHKPAQMGLFSSVDLARRQKYSGELGSLVTNTAPFNYFDTNASNFNMRFYRGLYLP